MKLIRSISMVFASATLLSLSMPSNVSSQMMDGKMGGHTERQCQMMDVGSMDSVGNMMGMCIDQADRFGLSEEQVMKMRPLHRKMQRDQARFAADLKIAEIDLMELMEVKDFDLEKASSAVKRIEEIKTAHRLGMLKSMKEVRSTLTEEQFKTMRKEMHTKADQKTPSKRKTIKKR